MINIVTLEALENDSQYQNDEVMIIFVQTVESVTTTSSELPYQLRSFSDVVVDEMPTDYFPPERHVDHKIELVPNSVPPHRPPFRMTPDELRLLKNEIDTLAAAGKIEPSVSPYGAPVLFVRKKDGSLRMCVDYRALNSQTIKNRYALPKIDEVLDQLGGAKLFSKLDLYSGYHQIRVDKNDIPKTAFRTRFGHWQFKCLSFGLCNAPATFQRLMNDIFRPYLDRFVCVYLDDIIIYSKTLEEHESHVKTVLSVLRKHRLFAKRSKCEFFQESMGYLGHVVSSGGISPDPEKIAAVKNWRTPRNVKGIQSFLGITGYYRKFIEGFSKIAKPLTDLTSKKNDWVWTEACQSAFNELKQRLLSAPILGLPVEDRMFQLSTDACDYAMGGVLEQLQLNSNGVEEPKVIAYLSAKFKAAELNYPVREKELLAIIHSLKHWRHYLLGSHFKIFTDHHSLKFLLTQKEVTGRIARWLDLLADYDFEIYYRAGDKNGAADGLSRIDVSEMLVEREDVGC